MQIDLTGKVVIVTGGRQGLGNCLVSNFLKEGCQVVTCSRDEAALQQVIDDWEATYPGQIAGAGFDVSTTKGVGQLVDLAVSKFGGVDVLVNNAATTAAGTVTTLTDEQWQAEFDIKLMSMVRTARAVAPIMKERGGGSLVSCCLGVGRCLVSCVFGISHFLGGGCCFVSSCLRISRGLVSCRLRLGRGFCSCGLRLGRCLVSHRNSWKPSW